MDPQKFRSENIVSTVQKTKESESEAGCFLIKFFTILVCCLNFFEINNNLYTTLKESDKNIRCYFSF